MYNSVFNVLTSPIFFHRLEIELGIKKDTPATISSSNYESDFASSQQPGINMNNVNSNNKYLQIKSSIKFLY